MQLFISYAHADEDRVRQLVELLRVAGHEPWFDEWLLPGQDWQEALTDTIGSCDALLYALTAKSITSEYCQWEFGTAVEIGKPVIPVLLEEDATLPGLLNRYQYADFTKDPETNGFGFAVSVARLIGGLSRIAVTISPDQVARPEMPAQETTSGAIRSTDYDPETRILTITFPRGRIYEYNDVPAGIYQGLSASHSPGRYFHRYIRDQFPYRRVE